MMNWLFSRKKLEINVDVHSHLLPGLDDGVKSFDESIEILQFMQSLGYKKMITTPHINSEVYPNTPETIREKYTVLKQKMKNYGVSIEVEFAAEYFLDNHFLSLIKQSEPLLTFGDNYVLFETSFFNKPMIFDEAVFQLKSRGYRPVLAHPERYHYLDRDISWLKEIHQKGVLFQVNLPSLLSVYGKAPGKVAKRLINESMVDFFGSDLHRSRQIPVMKRVLKSKVFKKEPLNNTL